MNETEKLYSQYLDNLQRNGDITAFWYEPVTLHLAHRTSYKPDFMVLLPTGEIEIHEVKGFMRDDARVKIKIAADKYPFKFILVWAGGKKQPFRFEEVPGWD